MMPISIRTDRAPTPSPPAMSFTLTIDFNKPLALFPLNQCVLLPHTTAPLHIFEERYRAMTRDALDSAGLIAMAVFDGDDFKDDYEGRPPIRDHLCVGYIVQHDRFPDGRYNILLQGVARAKLREEVEPGAGGYRRAMLKPTERSAMEIDLDAQRQALEVLLEDDALQQLAGVTAVQNWATPELPTAALTDLAWNTLSRDREERYGVLAEPCPIRRADRLISMLRQTRRTLQIAQRMGPCTGEHGLGLN
ncbi:LON peptidase substrate-binding domain-containing protein [Phycisphaeraceae bacterium D3-23]